MDDKRPETGLKYLWTEFKYATEDFMSYLRMLAWSAPLILAIAIYGRYEKNKGSAGSMLGEHNRAFKSKTFQKYVSPTKGPDSRSTYILGKSAPWRTQGIPFFGVGYETLDSKFLH